MPSQFELDGVYMHTAMKYAQMSKAIRAKVGAVLITNTGVIIPGFNGTPVGLNNVCEEWFTELEDHKIVTKNRTKPEVIHAELNAILKAAKEGISCLNATVYVTLSPCVQCSAMLINAGIKELVYNQVYRDTKGLELLQQANVKVRNYHE